MSTPSTARRGKTAYLTDRNHRELAQIRLDHGGSIQYHLNSIVARGLAGYRKLLRRKHLRGQQ